MTVFTDANLNVLNPGLFAVIQNASAASANNFAAVRLDVGCLAHHYRFVGIEWNYQAVGTVNEFDGPNYAQFLSLSPANYHITFDRNWVHGGAYPERDWKWCDYCEGHYISLLNSVIDNLNFWTPSWSATPLVLTSGAVITIPAGNFYFGNGTGDKLAAASGGTLTITAGASTGNAVLEADRSQFYLVVPTGISAACVIAGQTCTVSNTGSPAYSQSGGYYSRLPIANPTISGGAWTSTGENSPPNLSLGQGSSSQEGGNAVFVNRGPGPYLFQGNIFHNDAGITFYFTGDYGGYANAFGSGACGAAGLTGCPWLAVPGDLVFYRNRMIIDDALRANELNSAWNGRFYSMRQHYEYKAGQRTQIVGNIFSGAFCNNFSGRGVVFAFSNIGGPPTTSSDHEIGWNTINGNCQGIQILGTFPGTGVSGGYNSQHIWLHDNYWKVDRYKYVTFNATQAPGDNGSYLSINKGPGDVTVQHEFFDINKGTSPANVFICQLQEGLAVQNNIIGYSNDDNLNGWWFAGCQSPPTPPSIPSPTGVFGSALMTAEVPNHLLWNNNVFLGGYSHSATNTEMNSSDIATQAALWTGLLTTVYASGNTIAARTAAIGFTAYNIRAFQLQSASPYVSGGASRASDGLDLGPDTLKQCVQQGCVQNVRARSIGPTSAIVSFVAPDSTGCSVDVSTNGLATFNRVNSTGGSRVRDVALNGLTPANVYIYRVNCEVQQPVRTLTTTP